MPRFVAGFARIICLFFALPSLIPWAHSEDVKLREAAVALLERATNVSLPGTVANYEAVVTFRVHYPDGSTKDGTYTRVAVGTPGNTAERDEETFGEFHGIRVRSGNRVSSTVGWMEPPEFRELRDQLPVHLARFDQEDIIKSIEETSIMMRPSKCIQFDTHFGSTLQHNELCMDNEHGYLVRWTVGNEYIENTDFKPVGDLWEPTHIRRSVHGVLRDRHRRHGRSQCLHSSHRALEQDVPMPDVSARDWYLHAPAFPRRKKHTDRRRRHNRNDSGDGKDRSAESAEFFGEH